ncbi:unnamed protein product [Sphagnum tenellum]
MVSRSLPVGDVRAITLKSSSVCFSFLSTKKRGWIDLVFDGLSCAHQEMHRGEQRGVQLLRLQNRCRS